MKFLGRKVLITGGARRIGAEIARILAGQGADILIHYDRSRKEALKLVSEIRGMGVKSEAAACSFYPSENLASRLSHFSKEVNRVLGPIDVLINNAAIFYPTPIETLKEKDWDQFLAINLKAPFFLAREFGLQMKKRKSGKIINIVDWTADRPARHFIPYAISKAGLIAATKGLAKALAPHVQVMGIAPGPILPAEYATKKEQKTAAERTLLERYGNPNDIAETIRFLIEDTDFMTGSIVNVDGGASLY